MNRLVLLTLGTWLASGCAARGVALELELPARSGSIAIELRNVDDVPPIYTTTLVTSDLDVVHAFIPYPAEGVPPLPWVLTVFDGTRRMSLERCVRSSEPLRDALTFSPWDRDGDGFRSRPRVDCEGEPLDCNDSDETTFPGSAWEISFCGLADVNCDGTIEPCPDSDGDGHLRCTSGATTGCDCNDANREVHPGATERCENGIDEDCNGRDMPCDRDGDGDGSPGSEDCDDGDPAIHPFAEERCNGMDDDCNGAVDDGATCVSVDRDGDGFLACGEAEPPCDANDCDAAVHPGAFDRCGDGVDADGDGMDACPEDDADGDGYLDVLRGGSDCDDTDPLTYPFAPDFCEDRVAQNCVADRPCTMDVDGDRWIEPAACEDGHASPGREEICNGRDDDCDGSVDEVLSPPFDGFPQGLTGCTTDPRARDFASDEDDCGGCGIRCEALERCADGACVGA